MSYESLAFFTGLFGGLHCLVMCGPLVMAMSPGGTTWQAVLSKLVYQLGRISTYSILGFCAGLIGSGFTLLGLQQVLSVVTGLSLILIAVLHFTGTKTGNATYLRVVTPIASLMGRYLSKPWGGAVAGALHGLVPCGLVYMAIASSLVTGSALAGGKFMFFFGLGTTPLLFAASLASLTFRRFKAPAFLIPSLFLIAGCFLILRGLNLNIPHLSVPVSQNGSTLCELPLSNKFNEA